MRTLFNRTRESTLRFCKRGAQVCEVGCRQAALRDWVLPLELWLGVRV